jgi:carbonic anhydrase/acetyltransferase-like protein (isoleucine patch superfamily)
MLLFTIITGDAVGTFVVYKRSTSLTVITGPTVITGCTVITGPTVITGCTVITGATVITRCTVITGPTVITGATVITRCTVITGTAVINGATELTRRRTVITGPTVITRSVKITRRRTVITGPTVITRWRTFIVLMVMFPEHFPNKLTTTVDHANHLHSVSKRKQDLAEIHVRRVWVSPAWEGVLKKTLKLWATGHSVTSTLVTIVKCVSLKQGFRIDFSHGTLLISPSAPSGYVQRWSSNNSRRH